MEKNAFEKSLSACSMLLTLACVNYITKIHGMSLTLFSEVASSLCSLRPSFLCRYMMLSVYQSTALERTISHFAAALPIRHLEHAGFGNNFLG